MMAIVIDQQGAASRPVNFAELLQPPGTSSSVATASAASEFKTLWRPGKLMVTLSGSRPARSAS